MSNKILVSRLGNLVELYLDNQVVAEASTWVSGETSKAPTALDLVKAVKLAQEYAPKGIQILFV